MIPLVIAAHGTRDAEGEQECRNFAERVQKMLPDVPVALGFVELSEPSIPDALASVLSDEPRQRAVVVPLMLGTGGHVRVDIPEFIAEVKEKFPEVTIDYARHLGPDPRLLRAVRERLTTALADWDASETTLVFVGRGALVPKANADHVWATRMHLEEGGWADAEHAFIQVVPPNLSESLDRVYARGRRQIVVMGHWLFPGRLRTWTRQQATAWAEAHPDVELRLAEVIGDCDELAEVVVQRYQELLPGEGGGSTAYLSGLLVSGKPVVAFGAGPVSERRVLKLLEAGANVRLISPEASPVLADLTDDGALVWERREYQPGDVGEAWYVLASTDDAEVNAAISAEAEAKHTFCVRADDATGGSAWTPATASAGGFSVAVIGRKNPKRSKWLRAALLDALASEE